MARTWAPEGGSRQMKGRFNGTSGGAEPLFTPTDSATTPRSQSRLLMIGMAARVSPGTSLCAPPSSHKP